MRSGNRAVVLALALNLALLSAVTWAARWNPQIIDWTKNPKPKIGDWGFDRSGYPAGLYIHGVQCK